MCAPPLCAATFAIKVFSRLLLSTNAVSTVTAFTAISSTSPLAIISTHLHTYRESDITANFSSLGCRTSAAKTAHISTALISHDFLAHDPAKFK